MSCGDIEPLRLRSTLRGYGKLVRGHKSRVLIHRQTLLNMMLVGRDIHTEATSSLYRYVPFRLPITYAPIKYALDISLGKFPKNDEYLANLAKCKDKLLAELAQCRVLIPARDRRLDDVENYVPVAKHMIQLLKWWQRGESVRVPSAQLHIPILDYIQGSEIDAMANSILKWLAKHEPNNDYLKGSIRLVLNDNHYDPLFADFRICSISVGPNLYRASLINQRRRQIDQVRRLYRRYPHLVISSIDWTTMEEKPVDQEGLEIVTFDPYIPRVGATALGGSAVLVGHTFGSAGIGGPYISFRVQQTQAG